MREVQYPYSFCFHQKGHQEHSTLYCSTLALKLVQSYQEQQIALVSLSYGKQTNQPSPPKKKQNKKNKYETCYRKSENLEQCSEALGPICLFVRKENYQDLNKHSKCAFVMYADFYCAHFAVVSLCQREEKTDFKQENKPFFSLFLLG